MRLDLGLPLPSPARDGDAGLDLLAREGCVLAPGGGRAAVPTGIGLALPPGHVALVMPRSGLALRHGVTCLNAPGVVDAGYRGEISVVLVNTDPSEKFEVRRGDRVAQLVVQRFERVIWRPVADLPPSPRGTGGFGSTGS